MQTRCKCFCNNKQRWNKDKCKCECKELIDKGVFDKGFVWNPSNCECECDNSCNIVEYLEHENCKCRKKVVDKRLKNVLKLAKITLAKNENKHK